MRGDGVEHSLFGEGRVVEIDGDNVVVYFKKGLTKQLNIAFCATQKIMKWLWEPKELVASDILAGLAWCYMCTCATASVRGVVVYAGQNIVVVRDWLGNVQLGLALARRVACIGTSCRCKALFVKYEKKQACKSKLASCRN